MIEIRYQTDGYTHDLSLRGHANYSEYGKDIVCAGVSAIVYSLLGWLENNAYDVTTCDYDAAGGDVHIYCEGTEKLESVMDMVIIGLEQIAYRYPDNVIIL